MRVLLFAGLFSICSSLKSGLSVLTMSPYLSEQEVSALAAKAIVKAAVACMSCLMMYLRFMILFCLRDCAALHGGAL